MRSVKSQQASEKVPNKKIVYKQGIPLKYQKNVSSKSLIIDHQRLHKIQLKTIQILNKYFTELSNKQPSQLHLKINNGKTIEYSTPYPQYSKIRDRFFSLSQQHQNQIHQQIQQLRKTFENLNEAKSVNKIHKKLARAKTESRDLNQQIKQYEKQVIKNLKNLTNQGNQWFQLNKITTEKQLWRQRNMASANNQKAGVNAEFFIRKITTDYDFQKKRITDNLKKLNYLSGARKKQSSNKNLLEIQEDNKENHMSAYERKNKFVRKAWKSEPKCEQRQLFVRKNTKNKQPNPHEENRIKNKSQSLGWGMKHVDLSKFYSQYQKLTKGNDNSGRNDYLLSEQKQKDHKIKYRLLKQKSNILEHKNRKKLIL